MKRVNFALSLAFLILAACSKPAEQQSTTTTSAPAASTTTTATAAPTPAPTAVPAPATPSVGTLASQETNWNGITAELTEFRRKGNTLTAKMRFVNHGSAEPQVELHFNETYLLDTGAGKKYEVLKDEKNAYIASLSQGWSDRWFKNLKPGESQAIWMKFPAPPPETKAITLQIPNTPPFEDVTIQD
jgi:hypothetical protein